MATREQVAQRLVGILRSSVLDGSDRDVGLGAALGEDGLGLDSLALVEFLTAVEKEFGAKVPVDVWSRIDQLTLDDCAEAVLRATS
jgi:acyl carrier protein